MALASLVVDGCAKQGEGERCAQTNGNDDCASGLFCTRTQGAGYICCPPKDKATLSECKNEGIVATTDAGSGDAIVPETLGDTTGAETPALDAADAPVAADADAADSLVPDAPSGDAGPKDDAADAG